MGVDYDAFLGIGKRFGSKTKAEEFLQTITYLTDEQIECMLDGGTHLGMTVECLDCYNDDGYFVGFEIGAESPDELANSVFDAHARWKAIFNNVPARVVHTVKVW